MLKAIIFCLTTGISPKSFSQGFINSSKTVVKKYLNDYIVKQHVKSVTTETDTSIMFLVRDASIQNLDLKIYFDKNGKCIKEERKLTCDSCLNKILDETLNSKEYN